MSTQREKAKVHSNNMHRMLAAAERYAQVDRSDPFTRDRILSHIENGIATPMRGTRTRIEKWNRDDHGKSITPANSSEDAFYDCDIRVETHEYDDGNGGTITKNVTTYNNMIRP